ncbi:MULTISPECIES: hypothetical protein [Bacteria]|jgi:hypothetical protein|uniref:hypothetical protein n=1 Tax=Bacteria TaxID=2 RepID=UPI002A36F37C|nr:MULTISPECIES: hypothetical protein [Sphaerochaeta]MDD2297992.1 hypothetical protein [Sphaerochaetaceae bacterium]MDX9985323.1 hypothetical protein [Sphaerochaeta sp.]MEA5107084.1 hypothetical protein [Sphaerochaeta associata]
MIGEMLQKWIEKESRDFGYGELQIVLTYHEGKLKYIDKTKRERVRFEEGRLQFAK